MSSAAETVDGSLAALTVGDIDVGGSRWRVAHRLHRNGEPPSTQTPLLLCNGIGVNWQLFGPLIDALGSRPLIAFDAPGSGGSPPAPRAYRMPALAGQVASLLDLLGVGRFDLLGVSWGGALAQELAWQQPARCRRLVLAATSTGWTGFPGRWSALMQLASARRFADASAAARVLPQVYGGRVRHDATALHAYLRRLRPPHPEGYAQQMSALSGWTSLWWLPMLRQPALLLAGRDDPLVPVTNARLMHALMCRSQLHEVDDGHLLLHTGAHELAPRIAGFLDT